MQSVLHPILTFLYPPQCYHCQLPQESHQHLLCKDCLGLLQLSNVKLGRIATAFELDGPGASLLHRLRKKGSEHIAEALASFLLMRWDSLKWPMPDMITYVPSPWLRCLDRGFTPSLLLAKYTSRLFDRPLYSLLHSNYHLAQVNLSHARRKELPLNCFSLKKNQNLQGKVILLIDDLIGTRTTMNQCIEALSSGFPKAVYGLTVCGAID